MSKPYTHQQKTILTKEYLFGPISIDGSSGDVTNPEHMQKQRARSGVHVLCCMLFLCATPQICKQLQARFGTQQMPLKHHTDIKTAIHKKQPVLQTGCQGFVAHTTLHGRCDQTTAVNQK